MKNQINQKGLNLKIWILISIFALFLFSTIVSANPASVYCAEIGGQPEVNDTSNGQQGLCVLPDGTKYDEWDLFGGIVGQNYTWCTKNSYGTEIKCNETNGFQDCKILCVMQDGTKKDMLTLMEFDKKIVGDYVIMNPIQTCDDNDSDGYNSVTIICMNGTDCDDSNPLIYLGAKEICNGIDDNCNGQIDEESVCSTGNYYDYYIIIALIIFVLAIGLFGIIRLFKKKQENLRA